MLIKESLRGCLGISNSHLVMTGSICGTQNHLGFVECAGRCIFRSLMTQGYMVYPSHLVITQEDMLTTNFALTYLTEKH